MGEEVIDLTGDVAMNNTDITFDNLTILKEFSNIANLVRNEDFLETVPKSKLRRVKWAPMFNCLKQGILDEMVQEMTSMWQYENMPEKLEELEKQKEKFAESDCQLWRPKLGDVKSQLKAADIAKLQKQKVLLESLSKEYEGRVNRLKKTVAAKRGYLRALQLDIQKYQKKNEDFISNINHKIENHSNHIMSLAPMVDVDQINWTEKDLEMDD